MIRYILAGLLLLTPVAVQASDQSVVSGLLHKVATEQAKADAAYQFGVDALSMREASGLPAVLRDMDIAVKGVDRGVVKMAHMEVEEIKPISSEEAQAKMREGLHTLWQVNTVRRDWLRDTAASMRSGSIDKMRAVTEKYKEIMPQLSGYAFMALGLFMQAKTAIGMPENLAEFGGQ